MKEKVYGTGILLGLAAILFWVAAVQGCERTYDVETSLAMDAGLGGKAVVGIIAGKVSEISVLEANMLEAKVDKLESELAEIKEQQEKESLSETEEEEEDEAQEIRGENIKLVSVEGVKMDSSDIKFPRLIYHVGPHMDLISKINQALYEKIKSYIGWNYCSIDYEITYYDDDYISVLYKGVVEGLGAAHPNYIAEGVTVDMHTGEVISVGDVIEYSDLEEKLEKKEYEAESSFTDEFELEPGIIKTNGLQIGSRHGFYLRPDKIGIIYELSHEYEIVEINR